MPSTVALLRGINVGGRNPVAMTALAACFRDAGHEDVRTYLASGNVLFTPRPDAGPALEGALEAMLARRFGIEIPVVVRTRDELAATVAAAPADHGAPTLRSDVFFLKHPLTVDEVWAQLPELREGVDTVSPGVGAIYFSRVAARASRTRITVLMGMPVFRRMTVRSWRTTTRLLELFDEA